MISLSMRIYHGHIFVESKVWSNAHSKHLYKYQYSTKCKFRGKRPIIKNADMRVIV